MKRGRLLAAMASLSSEQLFTKFWEMLPETISTHYQYERLVWKCVMEVVEFLNGLTPSELMDTMVVLDVPSDTYLPWSFEQIGREERGIAISLVLIFPEVYFVFLGKTPSSLHSFPDPKGRHTSIEHTHFVSWKSLLWLAELIRHHRNSFRPLFDPAGLRSFLKLGLMRVDTREERGLLYLERVHRRWEQEAAVADEEESYTYLHGYCLYRRGYSTVLLGTEEEFFSQLEQEGKRCTYLSHPDLVITDWDLAYSDHEQERVTDFAGNVESADKTHRLLARLSEPVLVVTGYPSDSILDKFLQKREDRKYRRAIRKPHNGILQIESEIEEIEKWHGLGKYRAKEATPGAIHYQDGETTGPFRHSLPFGRALVVNALIERAEALKREELPTVRESILQALLALEARELLGGISRTTAYQASYLQVDGELSAELSWFGIRLQAETDRRIVEIEKDADKLLQLERDRVARSASGHGHFKTSAKAAANNSSDPQETNYLHHIFDLMRDKYNRSGQVESGEKCHRKIMELTAKMSGIQSRWPDRWVYKYIGLVTNYGTDIARIVVVSVGIVLVWWVIFWILLISLKSPDVNRHHPWFLALGHAVSPFIALQPGMEDYKEVVKHLEPQPPFIWIIGNFLALISEIVLAFVNLGLFLSVIYRKLMRGSV